MPRFRTSTSFPGWKGEAILAQSKPLVFADGTKGVGLKGFEAESVALDENGLSKEDLLVWDRHCDPAKLIEGRCGS